MNRSKQSLPNTDRPSCGSGPPEQAIPGEGPPEQRAATSGYVLTLYVASLTPRSVVAIQAVKDLCEKHLYDQYSLEIVDIYEHPSQAKREQIVAAPTLIKHLPLPLRRLIGDMTDEYRVLVGLDLRAWEEGGC